MTLLKVVLKPGMTTHVIYVDGLPIQAVKASSLHAIVCIEEDDVAAGAVKREFVLSPSTLSCRKGCSFDLWYFLSPDLFSHFSVKVTSTDNDDCSASRMDTCEIQDTGAYPSSMLLHRRVRATEDVSKADV
jgi:hypothetical protein